jgi:hypothetical protein
MVFYIQSHMHRSVHVGPMYVRNLYGGGGWRNTRRWLMISPLDSPAIVQEGHSGPGYTGWTGWDRKKQKKQRLWLV